LGGAELWTTIQDNKISLRDAPGAEGNRQIAPQPRLRIATVDKLCQELRRKHAQGVNNPTSTAAHRPVKTALGARGKRRTKTARQGKAGRAPRPNRPEKTARAPGRQPPKHASTHKVKKDRRGKEDAEARANCIT